MYMYSIARQSREGKENGQRERKSKSFHVFLDLLFSRKKRSPPVSLFFSTLVDIEREREMGREEEEV